MKKRIVLILVITAMLIAIVFKLAYNKTKIAEKNSPAKIEDIRIPVTTSNVKSEIMLEPLVKTGALAPLRASRVFSASGGQLQKVMFNLGDHVRKGQLLAIVDSRLLALDLQKAETNVAKLERDINNYRELLAGNAVTLEKVESMQQSYNDALNLAQQIRKQIADASIKAPDDGIIASKPVEQGIFIAAGTEVASIVNMSLLKVQVNLTEDEVYKVAKGQKIGITTAVYPGRIIPGVVIFISPQANQAFNYQVEITAPNDKSMPLLAGTFVNVDFSKKTERKVLLVSREALIESTTNAAVYVVINGKAIRREISVGRNYGDELEVLGGLEDKDKVVISGQVNLKDSALINVIK
ncbi:membrane fusion protein (multidrug efflux system) [Chitinophaga sp. W3I9]|uniref:efflux RND transporter periplasmic adaptor subunit n=1 Tax=unclassified Chitinophaga TaxID=2619133 RepID=UPI003D2264E0